METYEAPPPTASSRLLSKSHERSSIGPLNASTWAAHQAQQLSRAQSTSRQHVRHESHHKKRTSIFSMWSARVHAQTRTLPDSSPDATHLPLGENFATFTGEV